MGKINTETHWTCDVCAASGMGIGSSLPGAWRTWLLKRHGEHDLHAREVTVCPECNPYKHYECRQPQMRSFWARLFGKQHKADHVTQESDTSVCGTSEVSDGTR